jgi:hypothetical protein
MRLIVHPSRGTFPVFMTRLHPHRTILPWRKCPVVASMMTLMQSYICPNSKSNEFDLQAERLNTLYHFKATTIAPIPSAVPELLALFLTASIPRPFSMPDTSPSLRSSNPLVR